MTTDPASPSPPAPEGVEPVNEANRDMVRAFNEWTPGTPAPEGVEPVAGGRRAGKSKLVYNKATRTIDTVSIVTDEEVDQACAAWAKVDGYIFAELVPAAQERWRTGMKGFLLAARSGPVAASPAPPRTEVGEIVAALLDPSVTIPGIDNSQAYPMEVREKIVMWIKSYRKESSDA